MQRAFLSGKDPAFIFLYLQHTKIFMKKLLLLILTLSASPTFAQTADSAFSISGKIENIKTGLIYLTVYIGGNARKDSSNIIDGRFAFKGFISQPCNAILDIKDESRIICAFMLMLPI